VIRTRLLILGIYEAADIQSTRFYLCSRWRDQANGLVNKYELVALAYKCELFFWMYK
jgi:hypothetical protein